MNNTQRATIFILMVTVVVVWGLGLRVALRPGARADQEQPSVSPTIVDALAGITPTMTSRPSATPTPSSTATQTPTGTATASPTNTPTSSPTATASPTNTATSSPTATASATNTVTSTPTATASPTRTPTSTPTATASPTSTQTSTPTATASPTSTPSPSATPTQTSSPSPTVTATATRHHTATLSPPVGGTPIVPRTGRFLLVDQDEQIMYVYEDGTTIRVILVSTGRPVENGFTPAWRGDVGRYWGGGPFLDTNLHSDYMWYLFPGARGSILIHSVPYFWEDGAKIYDRPDALGEEPVSHGCVRVSTEDAQWLRRWNPVGVPIEITPWSGEIGPPDESLWPTLPPS